MLEVVVDGLVCLLLLALGWLVVRSRRVVGSHQALIVSDAKGERRVCFDDSYVLPWLHSTELVDISVKTVLVEPIALAAVGLLVGLFKADIIDGFMLYILLLLAFANLMGSVIFKRRAASKAASRIEVQHDRLQVGIDRMLIGPQNNVFEGSELEDLDVQDVGGVIALVARSDEKELVFGAGRPCAVRAPAQTRWDYRSPTHSGSASKG